MPDNQTKDSFLIPANEWICDGYSANIRFIAGVHETNLSIWEAEITFSPLPSSIDNSFLIKSDKIFLGQIEVNSATREHLLELIDNAIHGIIDTPEGKIALPNNDNLSYYSESNHRDQWFYQLHLAIRGKKNQFFTYIELTEIDNTLRLSSPPFDGLSDAAFWLGLSASGNDSRDPTINIKISPPVDLIINESSLTNDNFKITLHAHPKFDTKLIQFAIRGVPGDNLKSRLQVASKIKWQKIKNDRRIGKGSISIKNTDSILSILMVGNSTVRRQWFLDPNKARNNRLLAVMNFDKDLRMIKEAVLDETNSHKFESGIAALAFLFGFSPCIQLETNSPDLILQTPNGRLILVECTLKISDFASKIGKLVDRRGSLTKLLKKSGHPSSISSVLVCRLPRDQIAAHTEDLIAHKTILITQENLNEAFDKVRYHNDPDKILEEAVSKLQTSTQSHLTG